jgi:hypothetical protein
MPVAWCKASERRDAAQRRGPGKRQARGGRLARHRGGPATQPGLNHPQFSDDSETLPNHRHGVKDYFPIYIFGEIGAARNRNQSWTGGIGMHMMLLKRARVSDAQNVGEIGRLDCVGAMPGSSPEQRHENTRPVNLNICILFDQV